MMKLNPETLDIVKQTAEAAIKAYCEYASIEPELTEDGIGWVANAIRAVRSPSRDALLLNLGRFAAHAIRMSQNCVGSERDFRAAESEILASFALAGGGEKQAMAAASEQLTKIERDILMHWTVADKAKPFYSVVGVTRAINDARREVEHDLASAVENQTKQNSALSPSSSASAEAAGE